MNFDVTTYRFPLGYLEETAPGIMYHCHGFCEKAIKLPVVLDQNFLGLVLNLKNNFHYRLDDASGAPMQGILFKLQYNLVYIRRGGCELTAKKGKHSIFCIEFTPPYIEVLKGQFQVLDEFLTKIDDARAVISRSYPITAQTLFEIQRVLANRFNDEGTKILLKSKYVIISMDCLKQMGYLEGVPHEYIEKIHQAYDYMVKNLQFRCTVSFLANKVNMSARQLENGFKTIYGKTVYKVLTDERMNKAITLLRDSGLTINEIAQRVGYKNADTFYNTFKRNFGYPPMRLRKNEND
ncbi:AraC family transcriptional regulator [Fulvivirgaceae bacterium PWU4]|uniref:AraC family transcriptional regulator n=1 Tax=Chryseosolibacter histidini TaxID=2782349 RepID=A0AAP2DU03_9BACT|nr:AraC family transcriptional regulator [Chryseosolibacter histidini]MBT1701479.1 AraC family transcriptional regulator [Chryseosolibacter histidini]